MPITMKIRRTSTASVASASISAVSALVVRMSPAKNIHIVDNYMRDYSEGSEGLKEILAR